jgi:hypothetical protein
MKLSTLVKGLWLVLIKVGSLTKRRGFENQVHSLKHF